MSTLDMTVGSVFGDINFHDSLSIRIITPTLKNMSRRPGQESNPSHDASQAYPFTTLVPAQAGPVSNRHSMTVQHMLNPSDEEPRRLSQSRSSQSSDNDSERRLPGSHHGSSSPRSGPSFHNGRASHGSRRGHARATREARRRATRRASLSSSSSEASENDRRAFRKPYTVEETHFIW